jgi:hypothetical protein
MTSMPEPTDEIGRVPGRSAEQLEHHLAAAVPIIFTELCADWPARRLWSIDYLRSRFADRQVLVAAAQQGRLIVSAEGIPQQLLSLGDFLDGLAEGRRDRYLITPVRSMLPELFQDLRFPPVFERARFQDSRLWIGPGDFCTPLHRDLPDNLFAQIFGSKRVILVPREDRSRVYRRGLFSSAPNFARVDAEHPDLAKFPRFARARRLTCVVGPGEVLYIPQLWWHQLRSVDVSASVSLWWADGWAAWVARGAQSYARWRGLRP